MKKLFLYEGRGKKQVQTVIYAKVDDADYDYLNQWKWFLMKLYHCDTPIRYARRYEGSTREGNYKAVLLHRFIVGVDDKAIKCDHKDSDGLNCLRENIRICTHSQNMSYRRKLKTTSQKYMGVAKNGKKFSAECQHNGTRHYIGNFDNEIHAAVAYNYLAFGLKGEFAKLNDVYI